MRSGKVRHRGNAIDEAPPSSPAEVIGLEGLPQAGDQLVVVADRDKAKGIAGYREQKTREAQLSKSSRFPHGLANTSGLVGKHLTWDNGAEATALFEQPLNEFKSIQVTRADPRLLSGDAILVIAAFKKSGAACAAPLFG